MTGLDSEILAHNLGIAAELRSIVQALDAAGIPSLVLKGVPLRQRIGAGLARRAIVDNDILVRRSDVCRAKLAIEGLGYESLPWRILEHDLRHGFEHPLSRVDVDGRSLFCELHWNAFPPSLFSVREGLLWDRSIAVQVFGTRMRVFEPVLQLLHLASHTVQHELCEPQTIEMFGVAWTRWHGEIDTTALLRLAEQIGIRYVLEYVIEIARSLGLTEGGRLGASSSRVAIATRLFPAARLLHAAEDEYPERYLRALVALLLVSRSQAVAQLIARALPPPDPWVRQRGWRAVVGHYAARPIRPVARSTFPRVRRMVAAKAYVRVFRSLATGYARAPLDRLLDELERAPRTPRPLPVEELGRAVRLAERIAPRLSTTPNTCLFRALSRYALLSAHAHRATFVIGVAPQPDQPGHAWVEVAGNPFLEAAQPTGFSRILTRENLRA